MIAYNVVLPLLALCWGVIWAGVLQCTEPGRFLAQRRAWLAVVIGFGVDLLIVYPVLPHELWLELCAVVAASSVGIIGRSLANEYRDHCEQARLLRHKRQDG